MYDLNYSENDQWLMVIYSHKLLLIVRIIAVEDLFLGNLNFIINENNIERAKILNLIY